MHYIKIIFLLLLIWLINSLSAQGIIADADRLLMQQDTAEVIITNVGKKVNSSFHDYAPVISADGAMLIFTSRRPVEIYEIRESLESTEHVYMSQRNNENEPWNQAILLNKTINQVGRHNSAIALSNDGQRMLLYRDDPNGNGDIFESYLEGNNWTEPKSLGKSVCSRHHESSASISPDGRTLYFVSNRPGGLGGRDIWICKQDMSGKWGEAVNAGDIINSKEEEEGVYIHPDGKTLYFSSKKPGGLGGFDLYKSVYNKGKWSDPVNLGKPLNTSQDDNYFVLSASGKTGYYSSSMAGGLGQQDIYEVTFKPLATSKKDSGPRLLLLKGIIKDSLNGQPIGAEIQIVDNMKNEVLTVISSNSVSGKYLVSLPAGKNYGLKVSAKGYLFYSDNVDLPDTASYAEVIKNISLLKIEVGNKIILKNIFYDFDKSDLRPESEAELNNLAELLKSMPSLKIEISSHTDSKGSDEYNLKLSSSRAQSVVNYLIKLGIPQNRLVAKGYGESQPIGDNQNTEGQQMNRRTEFMILER